MNTSEALTRRLEELENQVKYSGSTWRADAQHPREAPPDISTPPSRHLENYPQKLSAGTIDLVEHSQAGNRELQAEVARLQRQAETSTASRSPRLQHSQEGGGGNSTGSPGSPTRYINLAQQQKGQIVAPPQQQPPNKLLGAEGAKDAQAAGLPQPYCAAADATRALCSVAQSVKSTSSAGVTRASEQSTAVLTAVAQEPSAQGYSGTIACPQYFCESSRYLGEAVTYIEGLPEALRQEIICQLGVAVFELACTSRLYLTEMRMAQDEGRLSKSKISRALINAGFPAIMANCSEETARRWHLVEAGRPGPGPAALFSGLGGFGVTTRPALVTGEGSTCSS